MLARLAPLLLTTAPVAELPLPPGCGDPPVGQAVFQERTQTNGAGATELIMFGRELTAEDGEQCSGMQLLTLVQLAATYSMFGKTGDAARIALVLVRYHETALARDPGKPELAANLTRAKLDLARARMALGEIEAFGDALALHLAQSPGQAKEPLFRADLTNLADFAMDSGDFATARDIARRVLNLLKPDLGTQGYYANETAEQEAEQARCEQFVAEQVAELQASLNPQNAANAEPFDEAAAERINQQMTTCVGISFASLTRGTARTNHARNLWIVADSSLALGDDASGETALQRLIAAPRDYSENTGQAELDLAKLLRRSDRPAWEALAQSARVKAKLNSGIRDPLAPWMGQSLPFAAVVGNQDQAGLTARVLLLAGESELILGRSDVALGYFKGAEPATSSALLKTGLISPRTQFLIGLALLGQNRPADALVPLESASNQFDAFAPTSRDARRIALNRNEGALDVHLALLEAALAANDREAIDRALLRAGRSQLSRSLASGVMRREGGSAAAALDAASRATQADRALTQAVARGAPQNELQQLAMVAAGRHQEAATKVEAASRNQPSLKLFGLGALSTTADIRAQLPAKSGVLIYALGSDRGYVALLTRDARTIVPIAAGRRRIAGSVARLRASTDFRQTKQGAHVPAFEQRESNFLYSALIAPIGTQLAGLDRLYISRTSPLDGLPFAALRNPASGQWLIDQAALSLILDPSTLMKAAPAESTRRPSVLAMGDPSVIAGRLFRDLTVDGAKPFVPARRPTPTSAPGQTLPGAQAELRSLVGIAGPRSLILSGASATEARFRTEAVKPFDIIAIASHAVTESVTYKTPRPAIVFTPIPRSGSTNDGLLHPDEIEGLAIKASTIILSACETASGDGQPGAEALSGLAQAFLYAGSRTILATQWRVESLSAASLITQTAQAMATTPDVARSLRRAMRMVRAKPGTSHPAFWAPFVVVERTIY